jgi:serine protease AprX
MTRRIFLAGRWAAVAALAAGALALAHFAPAASAAAPSRTIVTFDRATPAPERSRLVEAAGGRVVRDLHLIDGLGVAIDRRGAQRLARQAGVRAVTPDAPVRPSAIRGSSTGGAETTAAQCDGIWGSWCPGALATAFVQSTRADRAWADPQYAATGEGVGVAVIDTGIDGAVTDFLGADGSSRVVASAVVNPDATTADDRYGHGTHVAGLVAGNGRRLPASDRLYNRYLGTAPDAHLVSIKVSDDTGNATLIDVIDGLQFAVDFKDVYGIRVVNLSLSSTVARSYLEDPLDAAAEAAWFAGLVVVTAAGNRGDVPDAVSYAPANDPFVISVGGVDDRGTKFTGDDALASWSSHGLTQDGFAKPDLLAPAAHIVAPLAPDSAFVALCPTCVVDGRYFRIGGTSMASPVVAGIAAGLLSAHPDWTPNMVKQALVSNLRPIRGEGGEVAADIALYARLENVTANQDVAPSTLLDPVSLTVDFARASWRQATWSRAGDLLGASWSRASWKCEGCGGDAGVDTTRASWRRASWRCASWSSFFGSAPTEFGDMHGGDSGAAVPAAAARSHPIGGR